MIQLIYRPTYGVYLKGELIGYTNDKVTLQNKINSYVSSGDGSNIAFVDMDELPVYKSTMLKKDVDTNDDEIYDTVIASGTKYYKYYAITDDNEEKANLLTFADAEKAVNQLKDDDSANADDLGIVEKYDTKEVVGPGVEVPEEKKDSVIKTTTVDDAVEEIYVEKVYYSYSSYENIGVVIAGGTPVSTDLGVSLIKPVSGIISSRYGWRARDNHPGLDIAAPEGTAIKAAAAGTVTASGYTDGYEGYGNIVVVQSTGSLAIRYGHCSRVYVRVGEHVEQGQVIAAVGSTGYSTGPHLHFEIRYNGYTIDPQNYVYN